MKYLVLCCFVIGLSANVFAEDIDAHYGQNEEPCSKAGGRCILKSECVQLSEQSGLCPNQLANGFECCYGGPKSEYRCKKFGGECFKRPYCKRPFTKGTDCGAEEDCCILL